MYTVFGDRVQYLYIYTTGELCLNVSTMVSTGIYCLFIETDNPAL